VVVTVVASTPDRVAKVVVTAAFVAGSMMPPLEMAVLTVEESLEKASAV